MPECNICGRNLTLGLSLKDHIEVAHLDVVASYNCKLCGKGDFLAKEGFLSHVVRHHFSSAMEEEGDKDKANESKEHADGEQAPEGNGDNAPLVSNIEENESMKNEHFKESDEEEEVDVEIVESETSRGDLTKSTLSNEAEDSKNEDTNPMIGKVGEMLSFEVPSNKTENSQTCTDGIVSSSSKKKELKCHICGKRFISRAGLKGHISLIHLNVSKHTCHVCGMAWMNKNILTDHVNTVHLDIRAHRCDVCGKTFGQRGALKKHVDYVHLGREPHKCYDCGKNFASKRKLKVHVEAVQTGKEDKSSVKVHMVAVHTDNISKLVSEKDKLNCDVCGKTFARKSNLTQHVNRVHLSTFEAKCEACCETFAGRNFLRDHVNNVHRGIRAHKCEEGCKDYSQKGNLKARMDQVH